MPDNQTTAELHVIAQDYWHMPAWIIGNRKALTALRDAITETLDFGGFGVVHAFARDGEGYAALVVLRDEMSDVPFGYTDEIAGGKGKAPQPGWMQVLLKDAITP